MKSVFLTRIVRAITLKHLALRWGFLFTAIALAIVGAAPDRARLSAAPSLSAQTNHES